MLEAGRGVEVAIRDLVKRFPNARRPAVDGLSLRLAAGEFMTLLGPSGSGKTTTLNLIAGFEEVTSGAIELDGRDITNLPTHNRDVGMVFQHYALFPHMTAFDNVAFPLRRRKLPKEEIRNRVGTALELVQLGSYGSRYPHQLSGGEQQRIAVARAIVYNPRVLLMDEPLGALDKRLRDDMQVHLRQLHREVGITFLLVTHDQEEALSLSDRIAVCNGGRLEQVGTPRELYERPASVFVAEFFGAANLFSGEVDGARTELRNGNYALRLPGSHAATSGSAVLMVRPERAEIVMTDDVPHGDHNSLEASVKEVIYLGAVRRLVLEFPWGGTGAVKEAGSRWSPADRGDRVRMVWRRDDGVLIGHERKVANEGR